MDSRYTLSVIVPVLNEGAQIGDFLSVLKPQLGPCDEVIVVDGDSADDTAPRAREAGAQVVAGERGRAKQLNAGATAASGQGFVFLHADTVLPPVGLQRVREAFEAGGQWGRFDVCLSGSHPTFRMVERMISWRSRLSGIATGDQAIFISRTCFDEIGGFPDIPLMEDVEISKRLKRQAKPVCLRERVITSSRRWEKNGVLRTIMLMWLLRSAYAVGVRPARLADFYRHG
ncbi:MAG: TIGR04283 family arsenosugar biosynthesis glycosyltransferase [Gammaproteobacteria bacterium]|nr:TIGR04283 family arsenosugar biosynthesis glycosyltransferase [Gammaproteobacteria bacterium]